jgi:hypothetical protein
LFLKEIVDLGVPQDQIQKLGEVLVALASEHLTAKISMLMDEEEFNNWKAFIDAGANSAQQMLVIDKLLQKKTQKTLEELQVEIAGELMDNILTNLKERQEYTEKISKLTEQEAAQALEYLNRKEFKKLDDLLNKA